MSIKKWVSLGIIYVVAVFAAFGIITGQNPLASGEMEHDEHAEEHGGMNHSAEEMSSSGDIPAGLQEASDPTFEIGSEAIINADHMPGMDGAVAEISGAFDTTVYTVSYTTEEGQEISDHKWVIHEELENPDAAPLEAGTKVVLNANHMEGMDGANAEIDSADETTVYMVDFETTDTGEEVQYHKWVTEEELAPAD
ncbi:YdhK family protein [Oceanobacillus timonensis]|uniref:YdhK family protein n=1 Tax=Oceanobacillus timonensis TaxID=1926285 RepID=UPI0009BBBBD5|nr:YdhK family protein [Oceanobacillus timonensis]